VNTAEGVPFSFSVPAHGWESFGSISINKSETGPQGAEAIIYWSSFPDGDYTDPYGHYAHPCIRLLSPPVGPSAAHLAAAVSRAPGTELVTGPSNVTVGGYPAIHVVLTVRKKNVGCHPGFFYTWNDVDGGALWPRTVVGATMRVWIVDVDGTRLFIEAATTPQASSGLDQEIQEIVGSIRFDGSDPHSATTEAVGPIERLPVGQHTLNAEGVPFSFRVPTSGWWRSGDLYISKSTVGPQGAEATIYWTSISEGAYAEPCRQWWGSPVGSMAEFATNASIQGGTELITGPSDVTLGGYHAKHVVFTVREDVGCNPGFFYTWRDVDGGPFWASTDVGDTIRVWIVDVDGTRLYIEGDTHKYAGSDLEREIHQIVRSIRFG
jgi:hypothetical protein